MNELNQVTGSTPTKSVAVAAKKKVVARKPQPKVKAKAKATRKPASKATRFSVPDDAKVHVLAKENPRRPGTKRFKRFAAYKNNITVADLLKKSIITRRGIGFDAKQRLISLR